MSTNDEWLTARLRLIGARQFMVETMAAAKSVQGFGVAAQETAAKTKLSNIEMRAMQQGMYSLRRYAFYGTTAILAFGAATLKLGFTFDEARMQGTQAFTALLGGAAAAGREMQTLTGLTHETGVQLTTLTSAAEQMQGFGFSIRQVNTDLAALANYAERSGRGASGLSSLVEVFDRIRQSGKLTSLDLRTLNTQGISGLQILTKQLGLTQGQALALQKGKLIVPAQFALPALAAGIGARASALGPNLSQEVGIAHSWLSSILGGSEGGIFSFATQGLQQLNAAFKAQSKGGSFLSTLDPSGTLILGWHLLTAAVKGLIAPLVFIGKIVTTLGELFPPLGTVLRFAAKQTWLLEGAMIALSTWYTLTRGTMLLFAAGQLVWNGVMYGGLTVMRLFALYEAITTAGMWELNFAMDANPIGLVIVAVAGLIAGTYLLVKHFKDLTHWAREAWGWLSHFVGWLFGSGDPVGQSFTRTGSRGSQRPSASLPRGVQVKPTAATSHPLSGMAIHLTAVPGPINLDGKKIAESTFEWQGRIGARS